LIVLKELSDVNRNKLFCGPTNVDSDFTDS